MDLPEPAPPPGITRAFVILRPPVQTVPLVVASPHSGRTYDAAFVQSARLGPLDLRRSEDSFVEELFASTVDHGAPLLYAQFPRAYCDPNREAWELDPGMFSDSLPDWVNTTSPRVGAGLGTIARVVTSGEAIYREKLPFAEAQARVRDCWQPYHNALSQLIAETTETFGACLLLDCHSMPAGVGRTGGPDFVLGDAHGTACMAAVTALVERVLQGFGYDVRRNDPYAGGYVTRQYGRPGDGVHALQIEIARGLYMDERRIEPHAGFARLQRDMTDLIASMTRESFVIS
jgi:N-formylglutamate deformylase